MNYWVSLLSISRLDPGILLFRFQLRNSPGRGARALLEPRCGGTEGTEYRHISFKSSAGYVLIVYAFMYALLNGYLLCSKVNVIIYARTGALGGGRTHTWRILSPLSQPVRRE